MQTVAYLANEACGTRHQQCLAAVKLLDRNHGCPGSTRRSTLGRRWSCCCCRCHGERLPGAVSQLQPTTAMLNHWQKGHNVLALAQCTHAITKVDRYVSFNSFIVCRNRPRAERICSWVTCRQLVLRVPLPVQPLPINPYTQLGGIQTRTSLLTLQRSTGKGGVALPLPFCVTLRRCCGGRQRDGWIYVITWRESSDRSKSTFYFCCVLQY